MAKLGYFNVLWMFYYGCNFGSLLRSKKTHKNQKETQTRDWVSKCLSHFGLDSPGKQETSLSIQMTICEMTQISGILLENFCQAVGPPHTHLLKSRSWDLTHVQLYRRREEVHRKGEIPHTLLSGCTIQDKSVPSLHKPLQMSPSLL